MALELLLDEDVQTGLADALRRQGIDVVTVEEVGRRQLSDESQLEWATRQKRVLFTYNIKDFVALHNRWTERGWEHPGIIVSRQVTIGEALRPLSHLMQQRAPEDMINRVEFLSNWSF